MTEGAQGLFDYRYRAFYFDGNDNPPYTCTVDWWRPEAVIGERVVLCDCDHNLMLGTVTEVLEQPDGDKKMKGFIVVTPDFPTWLDGDEVLTLAVSYLEQATRNPINARVSLSEAGVE